MCRAFSPQTKIGYRGSDVKVQHRRLRRRRRRRKYHHSARVDHDHHDQHQPHAPTTFLSPGLSMFVGCVKPLCPFNRLSRARHCAYVYHSSPSMLVPLVGPRGSAFGCEHLSLNSCLPRRHGGRSSSSSVSRSLQISCDPSVDVGARLKMMMPPEQFQKSSVEVAKKKNKK